jgi:hypothetical protein
MESKGRGVLGPRFRGDDGVLWGGVVYHLTPHAPSQLPRIAERE